MDSSTEVSRNDGMPSAKPKPDTAEETRQAPTTSQDSCESRSEEGVPAALAW